MVPVRGPGSRRSGRDVGGVPPAREHERGGLGERRGRGLGRQLLGAGGEQLQPAAPLRLPERAARPSPQRRARALLRLRARPRGAGNGVDRARRGAAPALRGLALPAHHARPGRHGGVRRRGALRRRALAREPARSRLWLARRRDGAVGDRELQLLAARPPRLALDLGAHRTPGPRRLHARARRLGPSLRGRASPAARALARRRGRPLRAARLGGSEAALQSDREHRPRPRCSRPPPTESGSSCCASAARTPPRRRSTSPRDRPRSPSRSTIC